MQLRGSGAVMGAHYINVAPRYTCGSPASVNIELAEKIAEEERSSYKYVLEGIEGEKSKARAELDGLRLIVFEMVEVTKGWWAFDWLTEEMHWWPFFEKCPKCGERSSCSRGWINEHGCPFRFQGYVGRLANETERIKHGRRFYKGPKR